MNPYFDLYAIRRHSEVIIETPSINATASKEAPKDSEQIVEHLLA